MKKPFQVSLTVDMEHDCPPYFTTYRGVEEGTPQLLSMFKEEGILATFFTTGDVARRYPETVKAIVQHGHELGCHGDSHRKFIDLNPEEAQQEIEDSTKTLRHYFPVSSFRAPNLVFPQAYLKFLEANEYRLDSSEAKYKAAYYRRQKIATRLTRIPASITSSVLRLPKKIRFFWFSRLKSPAVLFVHPWEFVDFTQTDLRLDCRFKTGQPALDCLRENIRFFKKRGAQFQRMADLLE
jgi:peptidoglycan-N-acetylglucosamine deacetylase